MENEQAKKKRVLERLQQKMAEIEKLKEKMGEPTVPPDASPNETKELIEEITVPPLSVLKEEKKKKDEKESHAANTN